MSSSSLNNTTIIVSPLSQFLLDHASVTSGPLLGGAFADVFLQGVILNQMLQYALYNRASRTMDILVAFLAAFSTAKTIHALHIVYIQTIYYISHPEMLASITVYSQTHVDFILQPTWSAVIVLIIQGLFIRRCYVLTKLKWVACCSIVGLAGEIVAMGFLIRRLVHSEFIDLQNSTLWYSISSVLCDLTLNVTLAWYLWTSRTELPSTQNLIRRVYQITVLAALVPTLATIVLIIQLVVYPGWNSTFLIVNYALPKLFIMAWMYSLNCRGEMRREEEEKSTRLQFVFEATPSEPIRYGIYAEKLVLPPPIPIPQSISTPLSSSHAERKESHSSGWSGTTLGAYFTGRGSLASIYR